MLLGIILTLIYNQIFPVWVLYIAIAIGAILGAILGIRVKMIQMPQTVALLNGLGGGASAIVGGFALLGIGAITAPFSLTTSALALAVGTLTLFGSLVAAGKLHKILPQKSIIFKGQQALTIVSLVLIATTIVIAALGIIPTSLMWLILVTNILASASFGTLFSIRVGGADMPITISLLNSLSGVAGAIAGLAISDLLLVAVGGIVGASGLLLTQVMCKAINRKLFDILLGKTSCKMSQTKFASTKNSKSQNITASHSECAASKAEETDLQFENAKSNNAPTDLLTKNTNSKKIESSSKSESTSAKTESPSVKTESTMAMNENTLAITENIANKSESTSTKTEKEKTENPLDILKKAKSVIIVPGYGMAIAQAQHQVKRLADKLIENGTIVKYAIHPVAGRMPGHMNVLLCEANVEYEDLYEMKDINNEFATADVAIVVGANDVLNPAAREAVGTPIYGMPVLSVDCCKNIFIFNYDTKPGYAGVDNPLYTRKEGTYLYLGNASETLEKLIGAL